MRIDQNATHIGPCMVLVQEVPAKVSQLPVDIDSDSDIFFYIAENFFT